MPFYIGKPVIKGNILSSLDASYDFDAETITYTVELAKIISLMRLYFVRIIFKFRKRRLQFRQMVSILCVSVRQIHLDRRRMLLIIM